MFDKYLQSTYKDGGRGPDYYDCWGLVREARVELFGKRLLPSYGSISAYSYAAMTHATKQQAAVLTRARAAPGAMATCWRGRLCIHIALIVEVDGRPMALETCDKHGPRLTPVRRLESQYSGVIYLDD